MPYEQILYEQRGAVGLVTLNRPEKLNAWTQTMGEELRNAIAAANDDAGIGAVVVTGAGRAYCAGADISAWQHDLNDGSGGPAARRPQGRNAVTAPGDTWIHFLQRSKPVIAAVNGAAVGIGLTQILPMDIRMAGESARFGAVFLRMGVVPELASTFFLPQIVGLANALEMCLTARLLSAEEARAIGLVNRVVADDQLIDEALALGAQIAALPPPQVRLTKQLFAQNMVERDVDAVIAREGEALRQAYASPEFREAVTAFMQKRQPNFRNLAAV